MFHVCEFLEKLFDTLLELVLIFMKSKNVSAFKYSLSPWELELAEVRVWTDGIGMLGREWRQ
jgi:hypothetical protein